MLAIIRRRRLIVAAAVRAGAAAGRRPRPGAAAEPRALHQHASSPATRCGCSRRDNVVAPGARGLRRPRHRRRRRWRRCSRATSTPTARTASTTRSRNPPRGCGPELGAPVASGRRPPRGARGADRVHPGLLDRPHPARRPFPRLPLDRQGLRGADPARRDPRDPVGLRRPAARARRAPLPTDPARPPLRRRRCCSPSCRRWCVGVLAARLHQDRALRDPGADRGHADPRRHRAALGRPAARAAALPRRDGLPAADGLQDRPLPVPGAGPGRLALRRRPSSARCCSAPTSARRRSSPSSCRCRRWPAPSPTTSTRTATS